MIPPAPDFAGLASERFERAARLAARRHQGQTRRGSDVPYVQHVFAVAAILERAGFPEEVVIAGLLHDAIEDTATTFDEIASVCGAEAAEIVRQCSEEKLDAAGKTRPWIDRKRDHLHVLATAPEAARAVVLADKLHNLLCIAVDRKDGCAVWPLFHAPRDQVLWYHAAVVDACDQGEPGLARLARACRDLLAEVAEL